MNVLRLQRALRQLAARRYCRRASGRRDSNPRVQLGSWHPGSRLVDVGLTHGTKANSVGRLPSSLPCTIQI